LERILTVTDQQSLKDFLTDCKSSRRNPHRMEECGYVPVRNPDAKDGLWKVSRRLQAIYAKETLTPTERLAAAAHLA
jgi:hypothetical protein